jgi:undecaprenyl pyrophosphate phosphatase UppP
MCSRWGLKRRRRRRNHCFVKKKSFIFFKKNIKKQFKHKTFIKIQKIIFTFMLHQNNIVKKKKREKKETQNTLPNKTIIA